MTPDELEDIYGPLFKYSEHKRGDTITFRDPATKEEHTSTIVWVQAPGQSVEGGRHYPANYIMDQRDSLTGQLYTVEPGDVLER
jgi:hypothetical protein